MKCTRKAHLGCGVLEEKEPRGQRIERLSILDELNAWCHFPSHLMLKYAQLVNLKGQNIRSRSNNVRRNNISLSWTDIHMNAASKSFNWIKQSPSSCKGVTRCHCISMAFSFTASLSISCLTPQPKFCPQQLSRWNYDDSSSQNPEYGPILNRMYCVMYTISYNQTHRWSYEILNEYW